MGNLLPANEVRKIVSEFEPKYELKTILIGENEMIETSEIENLLTKEQFNHVISEING